MWRVLSVSTNHPQVQGFTARTHRTQKQLRFFTVKGYKAESAQGKSHRVKLRGTQAPAAMRPLPAEKHRLLLIPPTVNCNDNDICKVLSTRNARSSLRTWCFYQGSILQAHVHFVCVCVTEHEFQSFRPLEGEHMFTINHFHILLRQSRKYGSSSQA